MDKDKIGQLALATTKALAYTENGGAPDIQHPSKGQSGEMASIFQYTPETWKGVAAKYLGNANEPLTPDSETTATTARVAHWLSEGKSPEQIFSMWNAGEGEPDAYKGTFKNGKPSVGVNKYGVKFNVPNYVKIGMKHLATFAPEMGSVQAQSGEQQGDTASMHNMLSLLKGPTTDAKPQEGEKGIMPPKVARGPKVAGLVAGPKVPVV